jgi:hypothetical protein
MAEPPRRASAKDMGPARTFCLVFGVAFLLVALIESVMGTWRAGNVILADFTLTQNIIHWITGLALLGAYFAPEYVAKGFARTFGIIYILVALLGIAARTWTGQLVGYEGPLPWIYNLEHAALGIFGLIAGFTSRATTRQRRTTAAPRAP